MSKLCRAPGRRCPSRAPVGYDAGATWMPGLPRLGEPAIAPQESQAAPPEPKALAQLESGLSAFPQSLSRARWEDVAQWGVIWERERDGGKRRFVDNQMRCAAGLVELERKLAASPIQIFAGQAANFRVQPVKAWRQPQPHFKTA